MNGIQESQKSESALNVNQPIGIKKKLTQEKVRKFFDYRNGKLFWRVSERNNRYKGLVAGWDNKTTGYIHVSVDGCIYQVHRLIWLWHYGYESENDLDHIDRNPHNNKIENLREASRQCNLRNSKNRQNNTSGVKGVYWHKSSSKWRAFVTVYYKTTQLGYFSDFDEAVLTRLATEQCLDWDHCDANSPAYQYAIEHKLIKGSG